MNRKVARLSLLIGAALTLALCSALMAAPLRVGFLAGNLKFAKTMNPADQAYLGLKNPGEFSLKDIQADYVLVEVLNADCPHCMEQAAALNRLYHLVEGSELKDRIKFIGVVSNSDSRTAGWKSAYKVPFPLVPDPEWVIGNDILKITGTPTTVVLDKQGKVIIFHDGVFTDANKAFKGLRSKIK
ncbi:MAG: TlpA disulfide reductase family protein [Desulfobaccales bacterium]